jgi:hypothetical protein
MVESMLRTPVIARLGTAIAEALDEGVTQRELISVVLTTVSTHTTSMQMSKDECEAFQAPGPNAVYTKLPPGLITLSDAAREYDLNHRTIRNWVRKGDLKVHGRLKGSAKGGGFILLNEAALRVCVYLPKDKGGRPKKT